MAQIKKISTELQLLDKLLDTSGDAGTSGQLLSSTGTGTNWITFSGVTASNGSSGRAAFFTGSTTIEGSDNFYWDNSNARLGIGTSSPAVTLHVSGFARANALQLTNANAQIYNISNSSLRLGTNNTERMRIDASGNVGIGTTSPSNTLDVNGGAEFNAETYIRSQSNVGLRVQTIDQGIGGSDGLRVGLNGTHAFVWNYENTPLSFGTNGSQKATILANGNVGIGTTSPSTKLHVRNGEATIASDTDGVKLSYSNGNSSGIIDTAFSDNNLEFRTNGTAKMWIANAGNVGIGTTNPQTKLHVEGITRVTESSNTAFYGGDYVRVFGNQYYSFRNTGGSTIAQIHMNGNSYFNGGNVGIGTTSPVTKLNVVGNVSVSATKAYRMYNAANNAWGEMSFVEADNRIQFNRGIQNSGTDFRLSEDTNASFVCANEGNLGIGTTSPAVKLDVNGVLNLQGGTWNGGGSESDHTIVAAAITEGHFIFTKDGDNLRRLIGKTSDIIEIGQSGTALIDGISFKSGSTPLYRWYNDTSEIMRLNDLGLGIGTTLPVNPLHVEGDFTLRGNQYMGDDEKLTLGLGEDLEIYHNASNSIIENNTGDLILKNNANDKDIIFQSDDGSGGTATYFLLDGSIGPGTGSTFTRFPDNSRAVFGTASDLQIYHDGTHSYITENNSGGSLIVRGSNFAVQSSDGTDDFITTVADQGVNLFYNDVKKFETTSTGATVTGYLTVTDSLLATNAVVIGTAGTPEQVAIFEGSTNEMWFQQGTSGGTVRYQTDNFIINGHNGNETQFTSTKDGSVDLYYDNSKKFETTSDGVLVSGFLESKKADTGAGYNDGIARFVNETTATSGGSAVINVRNTYGIGFGGLIKFWSTSTATSVGNISFNSSRTAVNYNTGSDYRLKEDYKDFNALDLTSKIKVYDFKWKNVNDRSYGVIAHELNEIVPSVVSGDKDGEEMQSVDYSKLVPVLIKSIQELEARLAALEN